MRNVLSTGAEVATGMTTFLGMPAHARVGSDTPAIDRHCSSTCAPAPSTPPPG